MLTQQEEHKGRLKMAAARTYVVALWINCHQISITCPSMGRQQQKKKNRNNKK
jgi:hypothetical protein